MRENANAIMRVAREARSLIVAAQENIHDKDTVTELLDKVYEKLSESRKLAGRIRKDYD